MTGCAPCRDTGAVTGADGLAWPCPECGEHEFTELAGERTPGQYQHLPGVSAVDLDVFSLAAMRGQLTPAAHSSAAGAFPRPMPKQRGY